MRRSRFVLMLLAAGLIFGGEARAQLGFGNPLEGTYGFSTDGNAFLSNVSGKCMATNGSVDAALSGGIISFDGRGGITGSEVGVSIAATSCSAPNYNITGSYKITTTGDTHFEATGTLSIVFVGRPAACAGTILTNVPFTLMGSTIDGSFTITTAGAGAGSTYTEAPPPGPANCTGTIVNFTTSGAGSKL